MIQYLQINVTHHISKRKDKNHMIISTDTQKAFHKFQHPFMIKTIIKIGMEEIYPNIIKTIYGKPTTDIMLNSENLKAFPLKSGTRQGCPLLTLLLNTVLQILATGMRHKKENAFQLEGKKYLWIT